MLCVWASSSRLSISIYLYTYIPKYLYTYISIYLYTHTSIYIYLSLYLYTYIPIPLYTYIIYVVPICCLPAAACVLVVSCPRSRDSPRVLAACSPERCPCAHARLCLHRPCPSCLLARALSLCACLSAVLVLLPLLPRPIDTFVPFARALPACSPDRCFCCLLRAFLLLQPPSPQSQPHY